ncbi:MAG: hypothetical protein DMD83_25845, partial [Candidatus Rokuibacteriota bacterium]
MKRITLKASDLDVTFTPFLASTVRPLDRANASSHESFPAGNENSPGANETLTPWCFEQQFAFRSYIKNHAATTVAPIVPVII